MGNSISFLKSEVRKTYQQKRKIADSQKKAQIDALILQNVISLPEFQSCDLLLTYVSTEDEVDTRWPTVCVTDAEIQAEGRRAGYTLIIKK